MVMVDEADLVAVATAAQAEAEVSEAAEAAEVLAVVEAEALRPGTARLWADAG